MSVDTNYWRNHRKATNARYIQRYLLRAENYNQPTATNYEVLNSERINLLAAMEQAYQTKQWNQVTLFMKYLDSYLEVRGYWAELRTGLEQATTAANAIGHHVDAATFDSNLFRLIQNTTGFGGTNQEYLQILKIFLHHLQTFHTSNDKQNIAITCHQLGILEQTRGNYQEAEDYYQQSLAIKQEINDQAGIAATFHQLGTLAHKWGNYTSANKYYQQSFSLVTALDDQAAIARILHQLAVLAQDQGNLVMASNYYQQSLVINKALGNQAGIATTLHQLGTLAYQEGNLNDTANYYQQSLAIEEKLGNRAGIAQTLGELGNLAASSSDFTQAEHSYKRAIDIHQESGQIIEASLWMFNLALLYEQEKRLSEALALLEQAVEIADQTEFCQSKDYEISLKRIRRKTNGRKYRNLGMNWVAKVTKWFTRSGQNYFKKDITDK